MDLDASHDMLLKQSTPDNARYFKTVYQHFNKRPDSSLKEYLQFVEENTSEWLDNLPHSLKTRPALAKPKTALNVLLALPEVKADVSPEFCKKVETKLNQTFKNMIVSVVSKRTSAGQDKAQNIHLNDSGDDLLSDSEGSDYGGVISCPETPLKDREDQLLRKIRMLKQCISMLVEELHEGRGQWVKLLLDNI
jgi:hypothetical protein